MKTLGTNSSDPHRLLPLVFSAVAVLGVPDIRLGGGLVGRRGAVPVLSEGGGIGGGWRRRALIAALRLLERKGAAVRAFVLLDD